MKATGKTGSRNQARKRAYADQANRSSRNEHTLDGPIIGRLEMVTTEPIVKFVEDDEVPGWERAVVVGERKVKPYTRIVHDEGRVTEASSSMVRVAAAAGYSTDARKARRQQGAWSRCIANKQDSAHDFDGGRINCRSCGCPIEVARSTAA